MSFLADVRFQARLNRLIDRFAKIESAQISLISPINRVGRNYESIVAESNLMELALEAAGRACHFDISLLVSRCRTPLQQDLAEEWPGEHYRLLASLSSVLRASVAIEIGTLTGMGTMALLAGATRVITYDIRPWNSFDETLIRQEDFSSGRIEQRIGNLASTSFFRDELATLRQAQLIFIDGPKDGSFEFALMRKMIDFLTDSGIILVFDDIRVANMLRFWNDLELPKLDITSLGHWSGTGLAKL